MRSSLLLRYLRLLTWYTEARLSYLLGRALADTLHLVWVGLATFVALLCLSVALIFALVNLLGLPTAFLLTGILWLVIATVSPLLLRPWLYKRFRIGRHLYRMTLARSGLRLIEKKLLPTPSPSHPLSSILAPVFPFLLRWLWKWLQTRLRLLLRKIIPL